MWRSVPSELQSINTGACSGPSICALSLAPLDWIMGMVSPPLFVRSQLQGCDLPVDEVLRHTLVGEGIEQALDLVRTEVRSHARILAQHLFKMPLLGRCLAHRLLHHVVRFEAPELRAQRHHDG